MNNMNKTIFCQAIFQGYLLEIRAGMEEYL